MDFGEKLKTLRSEAKLTQSQLGMRLGVAKSIISYYENGNRYPSYDVLVKIARYFHVTTDYLLDVNATVVLDVSDLSAEDIAVVETVANALRKKKEL